MYYKIQWPCGMGFLGEQLNSILCQATSIETVLKKYIYIYRSLPSVDKGKVMWMTCYQQSFF